MSATVGTPLPVWSKARWLTVVLVVTAVQAGLVLSLTRWPSLPVPDARPNARVRLLHEAGPVLGDAGALLPDPLLFIRGDPRGFSGVAARSLPRSDYEVAEFTGTPRWLALDALARRAGQAPSPKAPAAYRPPEINVAVSTGGAIAPLLEPASLVTLRGALAKRPLTEPLNPPVMKSPEVLPASVVEVAVTGAGEVLMARLVSSSGLPLADDTALELARRARFTPLGDDRRDPALAATEAQWGEIVFTWRTEL
jgi:TonB family protein